MAFFQNVFAEEFRGNWVLGDRQQSLTFTCPVNTGRTSDIVCSYGNPPFDLMGVDANGNPRNVLTLMFALSSDLWKNWATINITIAGVDLSRITIPEIISSLEANNSFSSYFTAHHETTKNKEEKVSIRSKSKIKFFVVNGGTEEVLQFNRFAGVAELPNYFMRHTIGERFNFDDSNNCLIPLSRPISNILTTVWPVNPTMDSSNHGLQTGNIVVVINSNSTPSIDGEYTITVISPDRFELVDPPFNVTQPPGNVAGSPIGARGAWSTPVDRNVIDNAVDRYNKPLNLSFANSQEDWQLLRGRSGIFNFQLIDLDVEGRIIRIKEFGAGSRPGDMGRNIQYRYRAAGEFNPTHIWETPFQLTEDDITHANNTPP